MTSRIESIDSKSSKIKNIGKEILEFGRELKDWRLTASLLMAVIGYGLFVDGSLQKLWYNNENAINRQVTQIFPSYDQNKYQDALGVIVNFNANNELLIAKGERKLDVTSDMVQAEAYKISNKNGQELYKSKLNNSEKRFALELFPGAALALIGTLSSQMRRREIKRKTIPYNAHK